MHFLGAHQTPLFHPEIPSEVPNSYPLVAVLRKKNHAHLWLQDKPHESVYHPTGPKFILIFLDLLKRSILISILLFLKMNFI
jgi:hypothetical protein